MGEVNSITGTLGIGVFVGFGVGVTVGFGVGVGVGICVGLKVGVGVGDAIGVGVGSGVGLGVGVGEGVGDGDGVGVGSFVAQFQVIVEFEVRLKVTVKPVPLDGTEPVPDQPVQVQTLLPSVTGLEIEQVTCEAEL